MKRRTTYRHNAKAWMTSAIFFEFVRNFNSRMRERGKHELLFLDNISNHKIETELSSIRIEFLPPNSISHLHQPLQNSL